MIKFKLHFKSITCFLLQEHIIARGLLMTMFTSLCSSACPTQCAANASWHVSMRLFQVACQPFGADISITGNSPASILNPVEMVFKDEPLYVQGSHLCCSTWGKPGLALVRPWGWPSLIGRTAVLIEGGHSFLIPHTQMGLLKQLLFSKDVHMTLCDFRIRPGSRQLDPSMWIRSEGWNNSPRSRGRVRRASLVTCLPVICHHLPPSAPASVPPNTPHWSPFPKFYLPPTTSLCLSQSDLLQRQPHWYNSSIYGLAFPGGSVVKNPPANARKASLIPGSGRSPGEGNGNLLQYSCLENPMDRGAWWQKFV